MARTPDEGWISADEAAAWLEVRKRTLYAYASRGKVRTRVGSDGRSRSYHVGDLERLKTSSDARRGHAAVAARALRWGEPVLDTTVSGIDPVCGPVYRGVPATSFAEEGSTFEGVTAWLWQASVERPKVSLVRFRPSRRAPLDRMLERLAWLPDDASPSAILWTLPLCLASDARRHAEAVGAPSVALAILKALDVPIRRGRVRAIDAALVLSADHELNSSTFAARIAASTGASLRNAVLAGLATFAGPLHGANCDRIEALLAPIRSADVPRFVADRIRFGEGLPGLGHPLYPEGDPRGRVLFAIAEQLHARGKVSAYVTAARLAGHPLPSIDSALVALAESLRLPSGSASAIMAIGRTAGWIAHALEQRSVGVQLRPRAHYVGPATGSTAATSPDEPGSSGRRTRSAPGS